MTQSVGFEYIRSARYKEIAKIAILAVMVISLSYGGWAALKIVSATEHPVLVVVSGSMIPTFNVGDIIFIKGVPAEKINAGTIIVFHSPREYDTLVVHRVVQRLDNDGTPYFKTKGDFNRYVDDWTVPKEYVVGVYSARIPYIGILVMRLREPAGTAFITVLILLLIVYEIYSSSTKKKDEFKDKNPTQILKKAFLVNPNGLKDELTPYRS